jgi:hypothetical protein
MLSPTAVPFSGRPITRRHRGVKLISERNLQKAKYFPPGFFDSKSIQPTTADESPLSPKTTISKQEEALRRAKQFITQ